MMASEAADEPQQPDLQEFGRQARRIARQGLKIALATRDAQSGNPFISMAGAATAMDGAPVLLMSALARHRRNLDHDPHVSLLFEAAAERANPLTGARVSISGRVELLDNEHDQQRFESRQPKAFYAGFSDFAFFRLQPIDAHFVGGFGIAQTLPAKIYLLDIAPAEALRESEGELIAMLNDTRKQVMRQFVTDRLAAPRGAWRLTGIDPEGCDFMWKHRVLRYDFEARVHTPEQALAALSFT